MILPKGDRRREKYLGNGEILKKMRNAGGGAKGLMAGGITLLVFAVLLAAPCLRAPGAFADSLGEGRPE